MSFLKTILRLQNLSYYGQSIKLMQQVKRERNALKRLSDEQLLDIGKTKCEALGEFSKDIAFLRTVALSALECRALMITNFLSVA